jgi:topoisomerase IA-like protein
VLPQANWQESKKSCVNMARKYDDLWERHYLVIGRTRIAKKLPYATYVRAVNKSIDVGGDPYVMVGKQMAFIDYDKEPKKSTTTKKVTAKRKTAVKKVTAKRSVRRATAASKLARIKKIVC